MDNPADPIAAGPWWKKGMSLTQLAVYFAVSLFFVFSGFGISYFLEQQNKSTILTTPAMATLPAGELTLDITNPTEAMVVQEKLIKISGKTLPNTSLVVFGALDSKMGLSDENGNFEVEFELAKGTNTLTVAAVSGDGREKTVTADVTYGEVSKL